MRHGEVDEAYVKHIQNNTEAAIRDAGIIIFDPDRAGEPVTAAAYFSKPDEDRLYQLLQGDYQNTKALERDIRSISLVMKRRQNFRTELLFKAKHLLVTDNVILASSAQRFYIVTLPRTIIQ